MKGKTLIEKKVGNKFWSTDMKTKNARGKKRSQQKAEAERATRTIRRQSKFDKSVLPFFMVKAMIDNGVKVRYFTFE